MGRIVLGLDSFFLVFFGRLVENGEFFWFLILVLVLV